MTTPIKTIGENNRTNLQPTEAELEKAKDLIAKGKSQAKLNPSQTPQQAWSKFTQVRNKIRQFVENQDS